MNLVERARKLAQEYEPIPFDDYRSKLELLRPYLDLPTQTLEYSDSERGM